MAAVHAAETDAARLDLQQHIVAVPGAQGLADEPAQPDGRVRLSPVGEQDAEPWQRIGEHRAPSLRFVHGKPRSRNLPVQWWAD